MHWRDCAEHLFCMCAAAQTADRGQEGGGAGHAGRGRNAARWPRSLQALLLCWLPAALLHWRRTQRGLASLLSSGMPGDNDTALHGTRVQPVRVITLACARDYGPKRCAAGAFSLAVALSARTNSVAGGTFLPWTHLFRPPGPVWTPLFRRREAAPRQFCLYSRGKWDHLAQLFIMYSSHILSGV